MTPIVTNHHPNRCPYCGRRTDYHDYVVIAWVVLFLCMMAGSCS